MARPTKFTQTLVDKICDRLASGESLRKICADATMPAKITILRWLEKNEPFRAQYARARELQAENDVDEIIDIADSVKDGDANQIAAARLRVDARKWAASKKAPKKYGDKITQELTGTDGAAIKIELSGEELKQELIKRGLPTQYLEE